MKQFRLRVFFDNSASATIYCDIIISNDYTLKDLHLAILQAFYLEEDAQRYSTFHLSNKNWEQLQEYPLISPDESIMESMEDVTIDEIFEKSAYFIYMYDISIQHIFLIERIQSKIIKNSIEPYVDTEKGIHPNLFTFNKNQENTVHDDIYNVDTNNIYDDVSMDFDDDVYEEDNMTSEDNLYY